MSAITVHTDKNEMEASMTKGFLAIHGIRAIITPSSKPGYGYWVELDPQGPSRPYDIIVSEQEAKEAIELLKERDKENSNE